MPLKKAPYKFVNKTIRIEFYKRCAYFFYYKKILKCLDASALFYNLKKFF